MRGSRLQRRQVAGFTLVELLVVVTVLGLLMAILVPALRGARRVSKRVVCGTRLHTIGLGLRMYLTESNDYLPAVELLPSVPLDEDKPRPAIADVLLPYIRRNAGPMPGPGGGSDEATQSEGDEVFHCPADVAGKTGRESPNIGKSYFDSEKSSYMFSIKLGGRKLSDVVRSEAYQSFFGGGLAEEDLWLMRDYRAFHGKAGATGSVNYLYVDGRVGDLAR